MDTTKEIKFADDAFSPLPEGALDQDQIARKKTTYFKDGEISRRISQR